MISQRAIDFVISCEVSSRAYYEAHYTRPEWPGGNSGVTEGVGYDLGWTDAPKLVRDWRAITGSASFAAMQDCLGVHGSPARDLLPKVRGSIVVTWDMASKVFLNSDVPEYTSGVVQHIPAAAMLPADSLGALFSLAYNRGQSWDAPGDRYLEMRQIKAAVQAGTPEKVPDLIRAMKRHWPSTDPHSVDHGLRLRRDAEAKLFEDGLKAPEEKAPNTPMATEKPDPALPPAPASAGTHAGGAVAGTAAAGAAAQASQAGYTGLEVAAIVLAGAVIAVVVWLALRQIRQQPTLARAKDTPT